MLSLALSFFPRIPLSRRTFSRPTHFPIIGVLGPLRTPGPLPARRGLSIWFSLLDSDFPYALKVRPLRCLSDLSSRTSLTPSRLISVARSDPL